MDYWGCNKCDCRVGNSSIRWLFIPYNIAGEKEKMTHRKHKHYDLQQKFYGEYGRYRCFVICKSGTKDLITDPIWFEDDAYELEEIRPMYQLNGVQYPAPETEPLEMGQVYYVAAPQYQNKFTKELWRNDPVDLQMLDLGIVYLKPESAIQHATAMLAGKPVEEKE